MLSLYTNELFAFNLIVKKLEAPMTPEQSEKNRFKFLCDVRLFAERDHQGLIAILKAHLIIEQMLNEMIKCNLDWDDKKLDSCRLSFAQKIKITIAMERLDESVERSLTTLNKIRNLCAHDFSFELEDNHRVSIFEPFIKDTPYDTAIASTEDIKWKRWVYWILGLFFPTADIYAIEMGT